jgi:hypothetical protein
MSSGQTKSIVKNKKDLLNGLPDRPFLKLDYRFATNEALDLENPKTFDEKMNWLKLYNRRPEYTQMVDKYEVRQYVEEKIGAEYLIPLYDVWDSVEEIEWDSLPNQFVLKTTHDSGGVVICEDKESFDREAAKETLSQSLDYNYFNEGREWPYKNVKPRIIAEKYMESANEEFKDYKFFCFNGTVKMTQVLTDINSDEKVSQNFYDRDWNLMPLEEGSFPNSSEAMDPPYNYEKMIEIAETLAEDIPFVRVDLYEIDREIYFGEMTFFPNKGQNTFEPEEYNNILGSWLKLPDEKIENK